MDPILNKRNVPCRDVASATCQEFSTTLELDDAWKQPVLLGPGDEIPGFEPISGDNTPEANYYALGLKCEDELGNKNDVADLWSLLVVPGFTMEVNKPINKSNIFNNTVEIDVLTSNPTLCEFTLNGGEPESIPGNIGFEHKGELTGLNGSQSGLRYDMEITCEDYADNEVVETVNFFVFKDEQPPVLLRLWTSSSKLNVLLDEESTCFYSNEESEFDLNDDGVSQMAPSRDGRTHSTSINSETYHIGCEDIWHNVVYFTVHP